MQTSVFGTYTIGATGDFANVDTAVNYIAAHGICGPVILNIQSGMSNIKNLQMKQYLNIKLPLPPLDIQQKIIKECDEIDVKSEKLREENVRLKEEIEEIIKDISKKYDVEKIENILEKVEGNKTKIKQNEILKEGKYPVITQESDVLISGYTNVDKPITDLPLIVFGDHSCTFKYIDFPFVRGADGTQLLKPKKNIDINYFYYTLKQLNIPNKEEYSRHMKYLKNLKIPLPPLDIQKEIVSKIETIESKINQNQKIIDSSKSKKEEILKKYL